MFHGLCWELDRLVLYDLIQSPQNILAFVGVAFAFILDGATNYDSLKETNSPSATLEYASNLSWAIWLVGLVLIALLGVVAYRLGRWWLGAYAVLLLGVLTSV